MFSFFSDIKTILIIVLALAIIGLIVFLLIKFPASKYFFIGLGCLLVLVTGVFCGYADIQYFIAKGGIYGTVEDLVNRNEIVQNEYEFDFKNLNLTSVDGITYSARITYTNEKQLNINCTNKALFVNKRPTNLNKKASNFIISEYGYTFYDEDIEELCSDYLSIKFSFDEKITTCIISTSSGSSSAKYWNNYLKKNNFIVTIEDDTYQKDNSVNIDKAATNILKYYINDELYQTTTYEVGEEIKLLEYEVEEEYLFFGWFTEKPQGNLKALNGLTTITSNEPVEISLYGRYFYVDEVGEEGYFDCQLDLEFVYGDGLSENMSYGVVMLSYYDEELDYIRKYTTIIRPGVTEIKGLKYAEFTLSFRTSLNSSDIEPIKITTTGYNKITIYINYIEVDGVYSFTVV